MPRSQRAAAHAAKSKFPNAVKLMKEADPEVKKEGNENKNKKRYPGKALVLQSKTKEAKKETVEAMEAVAGALAVHQPHSGLSTGWSGSTTRRSLGPVGACTVSPVQLRMRRKRINKLERRCGASR